MSYNTMTRRGVPLSVKFLDTAEGTFTGLGAVFGNLDYNGDIIDPGAFTDTLREARAKKTRNNTPFLWPLCWMHDERMPIGGIVDARETEAGLAIDGFCDPNTEWGRMALSGLKMGYANELSIGFNTVSSTRDVKGIRHLTVVKLWEISVITTGYAANPLALADSASVKSRGDTGMDPKDYARFRPLLTTSYESTVHVDPEPERKDFGSEREYNTAMYRYLQKKLGWPTESVRMLEENEKLAQGAATQADGGYYDSPHESARVQLLSTTLDEINVAHVKLRAERVATGTATFAERLAEYQRTGRTPDGFTLPDTGYVFRVYDALDADPEIQRARAARDKE